MMKRSTPVAFVTTHDLRWVELPKRLRQGQVDVEPHPTDFHHQVTENRRAFLGAHWASVVQMFEPTLRRHFAYGRPPKSPFQGDA